MTNILIVAPSWVGDMVMAQSLFSLLKQQKPGCIIDVLAPDWTLPLLARMPEVSDAIDMPLGHGELKLGVRHHLGVHLRSRGYDQAIVLPNSLKSALIPFWAKIRQRTGYVGEMRQWLLNDCRKLDKKRLPMMAQRFVVLGLPDGATLSEPVTDPRLVTREEQSRAAVELLGIRYDDAPVLALCPGAEFGASKKWPEAYYAKIAQHWLDKGWQVWLFGSANDQPVCNTINSLTDKRCENLSGRTQLGDAIDLLALASFVLTNDSGLMHIAAALQRPMVAIFGSSDPKFTPPLSETARVECLELVCSPCFKRECPLGHLNCLKQLSPQRVTAAMQEAMSH